MEIAGSAAPTSLACQLQSAAMSGAVGAGVGGALGGVMGFVDGYSATGTLKGAFQHAGSGALMGLGAGAFLGGLSGAIDPYTCFVAGTQVVVGVKVEEADGSISTFSAEQLLELEQSGGGVATMLKVVGYTTSAIETLKKNNLIITRDQNEPDGPLVARRIEETFRRTADHLRILTIRSSSGSVQTLKTTDEHPFFVQGRGWIDARDVEVGQLLCEPGGGYAWLLESAYEPHPQGVRVYNLRIEQTHTYFVREAGSDTEPVWVHNAFCAGASIASREQGERFATLAQGWWDLLPESKAAGSTIAVTEIEGRPVVSLYANEGDGALQFRTDEIADFKAAVEESGGLAIHTQGEVHAEVALHQAFPEAPAIGISNPNGPCSGRCIPYFNKVGYRNLYWWVRGE